MCPYSGDSALAISTDFRETVNRNMLSEKTFTEQA